VKSTVYNFISIFPHLLSIPVILYTNVLSTVYFAKLSLLLVFIVFALFISKKRLLINEMDALVALFLFFSIFSILWGAQNIETIFYCVGMVSTGALSYILVRIVGNPHWGVKSLLAVLVFEIFCSFIAHNMDFYLTQYHGLFLGYRISEYAVVIDKLNWSSLLIGHGYGQDYAEVFLGSKGTLNHYGIYHNFYLTVFENTGVVGLSLLLMSVLLPILLVSEKKDKSILILPILWSAILLIEASRDGPWVLFWVLALASNEIEKHRKSR
jgi:hypothetical protein